MGDALVANGGLVSLALFQRSLQDSGVLGNWKMGDYSHALTYMQLRTISHEPRSVTKVRCASHRNIN